MDNYNWQVNGDRKIIKDREAFADAQILAKIAYSKCDEIFWAAAMRTLKVAYKGK